MASGYTFSDDSHRVIGDHLTVREVLDVAEGYTIPVPVLVGEQREVGRDNKMKDEMCEREGEGRE